MTCFCTIERRKLFHDGLEKKIIEKEGLQLTFNNRETYGFAGCEE
jgi:hypothetical protein